MQSQRGAAALLGGFAAGVVSGLVTPLLPWFLLLCMSLAVGIFAFLRNSGTAVTVLALLSGLAWSQIQCSAVINGQLETGMHGRIVTLSGQVSSIPEERHGRLRFQFHPDPAADYIPASILVSWYRDYPQLAAGEYWQLELRLMPPRGRVNFHGFGVL